MHSQNWVQDEGSLFLALNLNPARFHECSSASAATILEDSIRAVPSTEGGGGGGGVVVHTSSTGKNN